MALHLLRGLLAPAFILYDPTQELLAQPRELLLAIADLGIVGGWHSVTARRLPIASDDGGRELKHLVERAQGLRNWNLPVNPSEMMVRLCWVLGFRF